MQQSHQQPLSAWLAPYRVQRGQDCTHTSLGRPAGSYYIPGAAHDAFYAAYRAALARGEELCLTERHRHIGPVVVDLDFRFEPDERDGPAPARALDVALAAASASASTAAAASTSASSSQAVAAPAPAPAPAAGGAARRHGDAEVDRIVAIYCEQICAFCEVPQGAFDVYVTEKPRASRFKGLVKDGLHLTAPAVVTRPEVQLLIRRAVLAPLAHALQHLRLANRIEDVVDEAVIQANGWMMYGSRKPGGDAYAVTRRYTCDARTRAVARALLPPGVDAAAHRYVELFSLRNKFEETATREERREELEVFVAAQEDARRRREAVQAVLSGSDAPAAQNTCEDLEGVVRLVGLLSPARAEGYSEWVRLGWCLRNIDHRLLEAWDAFSRRSPKYVEGECPRLWNSMRKGTLGMGSLHMWARQDSPAEYAELIRASLRSALATAVSGLHHDVACVVYHKYQHQFACASLKNNTWYMFRDHRWRESDSGVELRKRISTEVWKEFKAYEASLTQRAMATDDENEQDTMSKLAARVQKVAGQLKNGTFKSQVVRECAELFYREDFESRLDANVHLLGFENGVYDLEQREFREGRPEDMLSFSTGNRYAPYRADHPCAADLARFWEQVHPDPAIRTYVLKSLASCLSGHVREERFNIWTGSGCHAKGARIMMADGRVKAVEDIAIGDQLMGDDSTPRRVLQLFRGTEDMWRVVPTKGEAFTVNGGHRLAMMTTHSVTVSRKGGRAAGTGRWTVSWMTWDDVKVVRHHNAAVATEEQARALKAKLDVDPTVVKSGDKTVVDVRKFVANVSPSTRRFFNQYRPNFVEFPAQLTEAALHPYVLGVWLGNGTTDKTEITNMPGPIMDRVFELLPPEVKVTAYSKGADSKAKQYHIAKADHVPRDRADGKRDRNALAKAMDVYGLLGDKHIPHAYLCNTKDVRMQVLAGLLDTDGSYQAHTNQYELTLKCERLMDDAISLARSLGFACYKRAVQKKCYNNGKVGTYYRTHIVGPGIEDIPVQLKYKAARERVKAKDVHRVGFRLERVEDGDFYGFELDGNHLHLMGDYVVTANSNGKSIAQSLMEKALGQQYCCKLSVSLLTQKRAASSAATPDIARARGRRLAVLQEPGSDEKLNVGLMKELSGNDTIQTRELFKAPVEWRPQFHLFLLCNALPSAPSEDGGTWRRIRVVAWGSKFCDNPNPAAPTEFPVDLELGTKLDAWKELFIAYLVDVMYPRYVDEKLHEPEAVLQCTREYQRSNDHHADFVDACVVRDPEASITLDELFAELKEWVRADAIQMRPSKNELRAYVDRTLCRGAPAKNTFLYRGLRLADRYAASGGDGGGDGLD